MNQANISSHFDLTAFRLNTVGLPDRQILDSSGTPSEDVLQKRLGLSRKYRRFLTSNKKKHRTLALYGNRKARANGFCYQTKAYQKLDSNFAVAGDDRISWETLVFQEFYPGWHLLAGKNKDDEPLDALTFPETDIRNSLKKQFKLAVGSDASAKIFLCTVQVLEKVTVEIKQWNTLDEGRKALVADVVFGAFTLFGPELLQEIISETPEILKYYSHVIKQNSTKKQPELAVEVVVRIPHVESATEADTSNHIQVVISEHQDLTSFYREISKIGASGIENFEDLSIAERLEHLVVSQLPRLKQNVGFSEAKFEFGISKFVSRLMESGKQTNLSLFTDPGFEGAFKTTWTAYLINIFKTEIPSDYFEKVVGQTKNVKSILAQYDIARSALNSTRIKIADLLLSFEKANFGLRLELKTTLASERMLEAQSSQDLNVIENKVISAFLPPNVPVSEMSEDSGPIKIRPKEYHKSAFIALQLFLKNFNRNELIEPSENVELESSVNEDLVDHSEGLIEKPRDVNLPSNLEEIKILPIVDASHSTVENIPDNAPVINQPPSQPVPSLIQIVSTKQDIVPNKPQIAVVDGATAPNLEVEIRNKFDTNDFTNLEINATASNALESNDLSYATDILSEVYPAEYEEDAEIAGERVHQCYKHRGLISHLHAENIALHWLKKGHLNAAYATLSISRSLEFIEGDGLSPVLIRAAYFGQHVWPGDITSVATIQRELNFLTSQQIDEQMSKKPGGKIVPYLLFASALQPALFAGHYTNAPHLLRQIKNEFEEETNKLINEVVIFSDQGHRLDLETLRKQPQTHGNHHRKKLLARLSDWRDRIINKQTGWAPARIAMTNCLKRPEFSEAINIIENGQTEQSSSVQDFLDRYSDQSAITALMEEEVKKARVGYHDVAVIERNALVWFQNSILDIRDIATSWLIDHQIVPSRTDAIHAFSPRFVNQLRSVQTELQRYSNLSVSFEQSCGIAIVLSMVTNLLSAIDGNINGIWEGKRAIAHFNLPPLLIESDGISTEDFKSQFFWLVEHCETGIDEKQFIQSAIASKEYRLAKLLLLSLGEKGNDVIPQLNEIEKQAAEIRRALIHEAQQIKVMLDNAILSAIIEDDRGAQIAAEIDYLSDSISNLDSLDSFDGLEEDLATRRRDLEARFNEETLRLQKEFEVMLSQARVQVGIDVVPDHWQEQVTRALKEKNLPVAVEMLEHLKACISEGKQVKVDEYGPNLTLSNFLKNQDGIHEFIMAHPNPREVGRLLLTNPIDGIDFSVVTVGLKDALGTLGEWRSRPLKVLSKENFERLVDLLDYMGFAVFDTEYTPSKIEYVHNRDFCHAFVTVKACETERPFPFFEPDAKSSQVTVIFAYKEWDALAFKSYLDGLRQPHQRTVFISSIPISSDTRNKLASISKSEQFTVFHVDPVMIAFIASMPRPPGQASRLRNFFLVSVPWTYFNPYTRQDTLRPAPAEMRYGLNNNVQMLTDMQGGAAIIYGGRQLGKSTMLHEAVRRFNSPSAHRHAFYIQMDKNMDRMKNLSKIAWEKARERVWGEIYHSLGQAKILRETPSTNTDEMILSVMKALGQGGPESVLICFDEIDPILELDSANSFGIFRGLSDLVNKPNRRLKVVIAGLQNVKRFQDTRNFPLPQLGSSIQVSILPTRDALHLVQEPLQILGYTFEDPLLANRILVLTNRHPGLIHIFCHELLSWMARRQKGEIGKTLISHSDVEKISREPIVQNLIGVRFNMTLNLDERYLVIVYGLINHNRSAGPFTSFQTKQIAETWWPKAFKHLTERQFEAFMEELVGLGVFRTTKNDGRNEYFLRNVNVLSLLGSQRDIEEKLVRAVDSIDQFDPLSAHGFPALNHASPLTLRDEKQLLSEKPVGEKENSNKNAMYSVAIVTGSVALGISPEYFLATLPSIGKFESQIGSETARDYKAKHYRDTDFKNILAFRTEVSQTITDFSRTNPSMLIISVGGRKSISDTLDMLDIAHELGDPTSLLTHRVRIIFLFEPKALLDWILAGEITSERESQQLFIGLDRWSNTALSHLINHIGLLNTNDEVEDLKRYSDGWYFSINILVQNKLRRPEINRISDFGESYTPIQSSKPKELEVFLRKTGLMDVTWGAPLCKKLLDYESFDIEDLQLILMEKEFEEISTLENLILKWMERLHIVEAPGNQGSAKSILYKVTPSIAVAIRTLYTNNIKQSV